jgi:murein DD-endopeptidase MepM/ murein hydrolase activator NlpD
MTRPLLWLLLAVIILTGAPAAAAVDPDPVPETGSWPLDPQPEVVGPFDPPTATWHAGHRGVDLAGRAGQTVHAALAGEVGFVGTIGGKQVVTVVHGTLRTTYEPVAALVSEGDAVAQGQPIGRLLTTAGHCFPATCLHWGLRRGDTYLDPLALVGDGPVRLLPLWRDTSQASQTVWESSWSPRLPPLLAWHSPLAAWETFRRVDVPADRPGAADRW